MKWKELKGLAAQDLPAKMAELKLQLMKDNAQVAIGTVPKSPGRIRAFKRTIARIHTIISQNEKKTEPKQ